MCVLISCEVAGDQVPEWFEGHLPEQSDADLPDSHALFLADRMAARLACPMVVYPWDRRLIRVGKSQRNHRLFDSAARQWPAAVRQRLIDELYQPYRDRLRDALVRVSVREGFVIHLSVQTYSLRDPKGRIRRGDVGLVYDPSHSPQVDLALDWIDEMWEIADMLKVRRNSPRAGTVDSIVRSMTERLGPDDYVGLEVFANRSWASRSVRLRDEAVDAMVDSLKSTLQWPIRDAA